MFAYVVYTANDSLIVEKQYQSEGAAKRSLSTNSKFSPETHEVLTDAEFEKRNVEIEVENLMTGKPAKIRKSQRGGPCDPSTERYWSM